MKIVFCGVFKNVYFMYNDGPVSPILFFIITSLIIYKKNYKYPLKKTEIYDLGYLNSKKFFFNVLDIKVYKQ